MNESIIPGDTVSIAPTSSRMNLVQTTRPVPDVARAIKFRVIAIAILSLATIELTLLAPDALMPAAHAGWPLSKAFVGPWPWSHLEGSRRVDVIGPIGNRLPESYRRRYNRPSYVGGKIAAKIEPSSQEAMAFHRAEALGLYDNNGVKGALTGQYCRGENCPPQRVEQHYFYPKPWEVLTVGPRSASKNTLPDQQRSEDFIPVPIPEPLPAAEGIPEPIQNEVEELLPPVRIEPGLSLPY